MTPTITPEALERIAGVAEHIERAVEYIDKAHPGATMLDRGPILTGMRRWARKIRSAIAELQAAPAAAGVPQPYNAGGIELTACQLHEALLMAGDPEFDTEFEDRPRVRIFQYEHGHSGPGVYCECVDVEEEGCIKLDGTSPAIRQPAAQPQAAGVQVYACPRCGTGMEVDPSAKPAAQPQAEQQGIHPDTIRLDKLHAEYWGLSAFDMPTGGGDADVGWRVVEYHMTEPQERVVAEVYKDDPREAIDVAMGAAAPSIAKRQPAQAEQQDVPELFVQWLEREMPAGTVIGRPAWWAPKLVRALRNAERGVLGGCNG